MDPVISNELFEVFCDGACALCGLSYPAFGKAQVSCTLSLPEIDCGSPDGARAMESVDSRPQRNLNLPEEPKSV